MAVEQATYTFLMGTNSIQHDNEMMLRLFVVVEHPIHSQPVFVFHRAIAMQPGSFTHSLHHVAGECFGECFDERKKAHESQVANLCWSIQRLNRTKWAKPVPDLCCQRADIVACVFRIRDVISSLNHTRSYKFIHLIPNFRCAMTEKINLLHIAIDARWTLFCLFAFFFFAGLCSGHEYAFEAHFPTLPSICLFDIVQYTLLPVEHR